MTTCVGRNLSHENQDHNQPKWCDYDRYFRAFFSGTFLCDYNISKITQNGMKEVVDDPIPEVKFLFTWF